MITLKKIPKDTKIVKAVCPTCNKRIHTIGFMENSKCNGITVICKFCGNVYEVKAE